MAGGHGHPMAAKVATPIPMNFYINVAKRWAPSAMTFGAFAGVMFLYFTDWKVFMDKVPIYRKKFEEKEPLI